MAADAAVPVVSDKIKLFSTVFESALFVNRMTLPAVFTKRKFCMEMFLAPSKVNTAPPPKGVVMVVARLGAPLNVTFLNGVDPGMSVRYKSAV